MLFNKKKSHFLEAIKKGDVAFLREFLLHHPEYLAKKFRPRIFSCYDGFALDMAAYFNQPKVIEFLVQEKMVDVNRQKGINQRWTALHVACVANSYEAAEKLISLGADASLKTSLGDLPVHICKWSRKTERLIQLFPVVKPVEEKKVVAQAEMESWTLTSPGEVVHDRELPGGYRLTDIFNFESRTWISIVKDIKSGFPAQNILFFDNVPDTQILHQAHAQLTALGGTAKAAAIDNKPLQGKRRLG